MDTGQDTAFSTASKPMKYALSIAVFYCCFTLGVFMTFLNPTVLDFSKKFDTTVDDVSIVFSVTAACYCVGALSCGVLCNFINRQIVVTVVLAAASAALFAIPHTSSITTFFIFGGVLGFGGGGMDMAQVAWIIDIWRHEAGPYLLSQVFAFSVGTLAPPLLLAPYLTTEEDNTTTTEGFSTEPVSSTTVKPAHSDLRIPFTVAGSLVALAVAILVVLYFVFRRMNNPPETIKETPNDVPTENSKRLRRRKIIIIVLSCAFIGFYAAMEVCTMNFLPTFAHFSKVNLTDAEGARVLLWLTIGFAIGRGLGIIAILKVAPQHILCVNLTLIFIGNTILVTAGGSSVPLLWVGSILLGLGFSTMYPAFYAYLEKLIFVSDTVAAIITVFSGAMCAIYPQIVGRFVEDHPRSLNYVDYLSFTISLISFIILLRFNRQRRDLEVKLTDHTE